jgi:hypothetical protein
MADDNITLLKALQGATYSPTESMYGIGAQTIASGIPLLTNPYDSPSQNFGTTVGAGLLAGLLGGYAKVDAAQENAQIMPLMGQIMQADPAERMAIAAGNPRLSPLVQALAYDDYSRKTKMDDAVKTKVAEFKALSPLEQQQLIDQKIIDTGFDQGQVPTDKGLIPVSDLGLKSPQEIKLQELRDAEQAKIDIEDARFGQTVPKLPPRELGILEQKYTEDLTKGPQATKVLEMNKAALNISDALKKNSPLAASTAIFEYAKLQDAIGTVREGDEMRVSDPGGPLGQLARLHNVIMQEGKLTASSKRAMAELIPILQKNSFSQYAQVADNYKKSLKGFGGDPSRLQVIEPAQIPVYESTEDLSAALPLPGESRPDFINRLKGF